MSNSFSIQNVNSQNITDLTINNLVVNGLNLNQDFIVGTPGLQVSSPTITPSAGITYIDSTEDSVTAFLPDGTPGTVKILKLLQKRSKRSYVETNIGSVYLDPGTAYRQLVYTQPAPGDGWVQYGNPLTDSFFPTKQITTLTVPTAPNNAEIGFSVSLSSNSFVLASGGPSANNLNGAVWIWNNNATNGELVTPTGLVHPMLSSQSMQGWSVSLDSNGTTLAVGAPNNNPTGAVVIWNFVNNVWTPYPQVIFDNTVVGGSRQGTSVSLSSDGNTLAFGGPNSTNGGSWIYTRVPGTLGPYTKQSSVPNGGLQASDNLANSAQGYAVSLSSEGNTLAVGAPIFGGSVGRVWIWVLINNVWTQETTPGLSASDAQSFINPNQGSSLALSANGNTLAVGGNTVIWAWVRNGGTWFQQTTPGITVPLSTSSDRIGRSITISGDGNVIATGTTNINSLPSFGAVYVFGRSDGSWFQLPPANGFIPSDDPTFSSSFSSSVSFNSGGDVLSIGGPTFNNDKGAVWIFS